VWASFALSLRAAGSSRLETADVALLRFCVPTLLLLPLLPSRWRALISAPRRAVGALLLGGGVPFFFLAADGGTHTSAAALGTLVPGLVPTFVALGRGLRILPDGPVAGTRASTGALGMVLAGVVLLVLPDLVGGNREGQLGAGMLIVASGLWAAYTLTLESIGLDPPACALLLCLPSALVVATLVAAGAVPSALGHVGMAEVLPFLLVQGIGVGFLAAITYPLAVQGLGAPRAALLGTASPVLVAVLAVPLLGEKLGPLPMAGVALVTAGVVWNQLTRAQNRAARGATADA
jgi:drug/metabolite transporter (DMT)-like permease